MHLYLIISVCLLVHPSCCNFQPNSGQMAVLRYTQGHTPCELVIVLAFCLGLRFQCHAHMHIPIFPVCIATHITYFSFLSCFKPCWPGLCTCVYVCPITLYLVSLPVVYFCTPHFFFLCMRCFHYPCISCVVLTWTLNLCFSFFLSYTYHPSLGTNTGGVLILLIITV